MKRWICLLVFIAAASTISAQMMSLEGSYQGINIYVQNPFAADGSAFCTDSVRVNGKKVDYKNANAFEIRLDSMGLAMGQKILLEIFHKGDCKPRVLPTNAPRRVSFEIVSISVDSTGLLKWTTKDEMGKFPFIIEQFRWNKWIKLGEVDGLGTSEEHTYEFKVSPHSGKNFMRVKQIDYAGAPRLSAPVEWLVPDLDVRILGDRHKQWEAILFNQKTMYELYDRKGDLIKKGEGTNIGIKGLKENFYYLNYDDKQETISIRPH